MFLTQKIGRKQLSMGLMGVGLIMAMAAGCTRVKTVSVADGHLDRPAPPLVLPSNATLELLGANGLQSTEFRILNSRKDVMLGADLPPAVAPVNLSQVYIRDQQWILNGRPWDNYQQTTRSLQLRSR